MSLFDGTDPTWTPTPDTQLTGREHIVNARLRDIVARLERVEDQIAQLRKEHRHGEEEASEG